MGRQAPRGRQRRRTRKLKAPDPASARLEGDHVVIASRKVTSATVRHVVRGLHEARRRNQRGLTLDAQEVEWGLPSAMLQIAAHVDNLRTRGMHFDLLLPQDRDAARLFENAGWAHLLAPHLNDPPSNHIDRHLPARRYRESSELVGLREEVLDFSMRFLGKLRPELLRAIEWSLDEITDNVLNHAEAKYGGILQVDAPKKHGFLQITVADGGRGIPASMREGHPQLHYDQNAVGEAIKVGVTRSPEVGQGNGLAGALRVATFSGGVFRVNSYRGYVAAEAKPSQSQKQITRGSLPEEALYGTVVDLQIRTDTNFDVADALSVVNWVDDWGYLEAKYGTENELVFRLADETRGLGSRDAGVGIRNKLETLLAADSTRAVVLDWSGVPTISSSFADEFVGKLLVKLGPVLFNSRIRFVGMEPFVAALVDKAMRQRAAQDFARERAA